MKSKHISKQKTYLQLQGFLGETPGQSVKELAERLGENRTSISGYLQALEDLGYVSSRWIGPAKVYSNSELIEVP